MTVSVVIAVLVSGFFTGALARFAIPGPDPMPIWLTVAIGLTGSIVGAVVGKSISHDNAYVISFLSFGVAMGLVAAYRRYVQKRPVFGPRGLEFPDRGLGVEQARERLQRLGLNPDAMRPDPGKLEHARLETMLRELERAGVLTEDELDEKLARLRDRSLES